MNVPIIWERQRNEINDRVVSNEKLIEMTDIIMADTCSLLHTGFWVFMTGASAQLKAAVRKIFVLYSAIRELEKLSLSDSFELRENARRAMGLLSYMLQHHVLVVTGDAEDPRINDVQIIEYVMRYRGSKRIAVITQDYQLTKDLQTLNRLRSYSGNDVQLYKFNSDNRLYRRIIMD